MGNVSFRTGDERSQRAFDSAEEKCRWNLKDFGGDRVLAEGGGYEKIWLETQPMGGAMYALRDMEAARNNILLFMRHQRADGRLPGSIQFAEGRQTPQFNKLQGFCFADPALELYFLDGRDATYLEALKETLVRFDAYLWRTRNVSGNGLLSSFCVYDTGEDAGVRYGDAPVWWEDDAPPEGFSVVPMASMDVTSWSFAARRALAEICGIQGDAASAECWAGKAREVATALRNGLWDERRGAFFDRDKHGRTIDVLCHNTLRCMYWGSLAQDMADKFVKEHLLNPEEFWTPFPLPSIAANDPAFRNAPENNWSGQPEGLTWQRAILALENYGYDRLVTELGGKLLAAVAENGYMFTQQFDPFTGKPSLVSSRTFAPPEPGCDDPVQDGYGPTTLACLEYIAHIWGIHPRRGNVWFSLGRGEPYEYDAAVYGHSYGIRAVGDRAEIRVDGKCLGTFDRGVRIVTSATGDILGETAT